MRNTALEIEAIENPQDLPDSVIREIQFTSQDIWSRVDSLGELCQCPVCKTIYAAEDIFPAELLAKKMVGELIQEQFGDSPIPCIHPECDGLTTFLYGSKHMEDIRARYTKSVNAFLVLCREKETGKIVGLEDGYIGNIRDAVLREFQHYNPSSIDMKEGFGEVWVNTIEEQIKGLLGYPPKTVLTFSSIGVMEKYQSPFVLFEILKQFAEILPGNCMIPGITEVDKRSVTYKMTTSTGGKLLSIEGNPQRMRQEYQGGLYMSYNPVEVYKKYCTMGPREFLKSLRA